MNSIIIFCSFLAFALAKNNCTTRETANFMDRNLNSKCVDALNRLELQLPPPNQNNPTLVHPSTSSLAEVCQQSCGGVYSNWLNTSCGDRYTSRMVQATCLYTAYTSTVGTRCRHAFPDAVDVRSIFVEFFNKCVPVSSYTQAGVCPDNCRPALTNIIDKLGCCYQSLYNNTDFVTSLKNTGLINDTVSTGLLYAGTVPAWKNCDVTIPILCEMIQFSGAVPTVHITFSVSMLLVVLVLLWL